MPRNCKTCARQGQNHRRAVWPGFGGFGGFVGLPRSVETAVTGDERIERAISVAGQFRSGGDGAAQHDLHLQEAYHR